MNTGQVYSIANKFIIFLAVSILQHYFLSHYHFGHLKFRETFSFAASIQTVRIKNSIALHR